MIPEDAPRAKAFRHIVEPWRALKGIISVVNFGLMRPANKRITRYVAQDFDRAGNPFFRRAVKEEYSILVIQ
jgi:hypothetical protein